MSGGDQLLRICGIGLLCAVCSLILKGKHGEFASLLRVGGALMLASLLAFAAKAVLEQISPLMADSVLGRYAAVMLKAVGIAILCGTCGDVCRDCGEQTVATGVEMAGNLAILGLCVPLLGEILQYASELLHMT